MLRFYIKYKYKSRFLSSGYINMLSVDISLYYVIRMFVWLKNVIMK